MLLDAMLRGSSNENGEEPMLMEGETERKVQRYQDFTDNKLKP